MRSRCRFTAPGYLTLQPGEALLDALQRVRLIGPAGTLLRRPAAPAEGETGPRCPFGDRAREQGDLAGALDAYRDSLTIAKALAQNDPSNNQWQCDLSISYNNIGTVLKEQRDLAGALDAYRNSLTIAKALAQNDPSNTQWQSDLSISHDNTGTVLKEQGDLAGALDAFEQAETILLHVKEANPTAATSASDLEWAQVQLAETRQKIAAAGNNK